FPGPNGFEGGGGTLNDSGITGIEGNSDAIGTGVFRDATVPQVHSKQIGVGGLGNVHRPLGANVAITKAAVIPSREATPTPVVDRSARNARQVSNLFISKPIASE